MTDDRIAELLGWPRGRANLDSSLMHRIRLIVAEAQAEQAAQIERMRAALTAARAHIAPAHAQESPDSVHEQIARLTAERDRYHDALIARHGGEPVALLAELDESRQNAETLAVMVRRLARALRRAEPAGAYQRLSDQALDLLGRYGLEGSVLRRENNDA